MRKHKNPWHIQPDWAGETVYIVAGGTSVRGLDLSLLKGRRVIAVNSSYETVPFADLLFFSDVRWYEEHKNRKAYLEFPGKVATVSRIVQDVPSRPALLRLHRHGQPGLATPNDGVICQRTSLQGAMNLAAHKGVARIVLIGADMRRAEDGTTHHHIPHKWKNRAGNKTWDVQMTQLVTTVEPLRALGIEVINVSPISRITWWPIMTFEQSLNLRPRKRGGLPPIKPTAYSVEKLKTSPKFSRAFAKGCGGNFKTTNELEPGPVAVFGRPYPVLDAAWAEKRDWYYGDHAYFRRFTYFRVTKNAYQIDGTGTPDFNRWKALGLEIKPWNTEGRDVLVCPPDPLVCERRKIDGAKWRADVAAILAKHTDRTIVWRDDPRHMKVPPPPLEAALARAWAVVSHHSNVSTDALLAGVPVFVTDLCGARALAETDLAKIETPRRPDNRLEWAAILAANQWTLKEIADGLCWKAIGER